MASWKTIAFLQTKPKKARSRSVFVDLKAPVERPRIFYDIADVTFRERQAFLAQQERGRRYVQIIELSKESEK